MGVANHVYRRGQTYVWRRRLPAGVDRAGCVQVTLRTRDPEVARRLAAVVTARSGAIFDDMVRKRLTPAEARGLFDRVIREETARLNDPGRTLSHVRGGDLRPSLPARLAQEVYSRVWKRVLRHGQGDAGDEAFLDGLAQTEAPEVYEAALRHLIDEAYAHAAPLLHESERPFAEQTVAEAVREADGVAEDQVLPLYRVIMAGRAAALDPKAGLTIRAASDIRPADDLDPTVPRIPAEWFEERSAERTAPTTAGPSAKPDSPPGSEDAPEPGGYDPALPAIADRVAQAQARDGISPAQQQQTRQTAALFAALTGLSDIRKLRQNHLAAFVDKLHALPRTYGKSPKDRERPIKSILAEAARLPPHERGLSVATINRHLAIVRRLWTRAGSEGIAVERMLDFDSLRRKETRRGRDRRDSLSVEEVRRFFQHPVFTGCKSAARRRVPGPEVIRDAAYWLPILAAYAGARREELAAMEVRDVRQIDGIWCLDLRPNGNRAALKNAASVRVVPAHSRLIELGFLDYVAGLPQDGNLFPELKRKTRNAGLGAHAAYLLSAIFEDQFAEGRGSRSFHSFRHYVTDQLRNAGSVEKHVRLDLLGHTGEDIEDEVYGSVSPLAARKAAIEMLPIVI